MNASNVARWGVGGLIVAATWALELPRAGAVEEPLASPLAEEREPQVLCQYLVYSSPRFICGKPPLEEVKKRCDERATAERGEPSECSCTDDPSYIQDVCD